VGAPLVSILFDIGAPPFFEKLGELYKLSLLGYYHVTKKWAPTSFQSYWVMA